MKIQPIYNTRIAFKSRDYEDDGILGYDDKQSQDVRQAIRNWQEIYYTPYQSLYKKECNLSEYQMNQLLGSLMKGPKVVDYSKVTGIPAYHVRPVEGTDETCYRGSTLVDHPKALKTLKDAGIERIIDLVGYFSYDKVSKDAGLEYYCPDFGRGQLGVWEEEAFLTTEGVIRKETYFYTPIEFEKNKKYLDELAKRQEIYSRKSVERFVDYITTLQKGYYYIGCEYGTYKTDDFLLLNEYFNPKVEAGVPRGAMFKLDMMLTLYEKLTPEDKKRMGWTKEFDENVPKRIQMAIDANIRFDEEREKFWQ